MFTHYFVAACAEVLAFLGVPQQPERTFGARFHRIDKEAAGFIAELEWDAASLAGDDRGPLPEGLGNDEPETLAQGFLDDDVREPLERIDLDIAHARQVCEELDACIALGRLLNLVVDRP